MVLVTAARHQNPGAGARSIRAAHPGRYDCASRAAEDGQRQRRMDRKPKLVTRFSDRCGCVAAGAHAVTQHGPCRVEVWDGSVAANGCDVMSATRQWRDWMSGIVVDTRGTSAPQRV